MGSSVRRNRAGGSKLACASMQGIAEPAKSKIGFCGIGIMGLAMTHNLLKAGYDVTVWNRSPEKCQPLVDAGAKRADSPEAVAQQSDVVLAMLADPPAAEEVAKSIAKGIGEGRDMWMSQQLMATLP